MSCHTTDDESFTFTDFSDDGVAIDDDIGLSMMVDKDLEQQREKQPVGQQTSNEEKLVSGGDACAMAESVLNGGPMRNDGLMEEMQAPTKAASSSQTPQAQSRSASDISPLSNSNSRHKQYTNLPKDRNPSGRGPCNEQSNPLPQASSNETDAEMTTSSNQHCRSRLHVATDGSEALTDPLADPHHVLAGIADGDGPSPCQAADLSIYPIVKKDKRLCRCMLSVAAATAFFIAIVLTAVYLTRR